MRYGGEKLKRAGGRTAMTLDFSRGSGSCLILLQLRCGKEEQWQRMEGAKAIQVNVTNGDS